MKETLQDLREAGVTVWMLTGDKVETACCIATSAGLKYPDEEFFKITYQNDPVRIEQLLDDLKSLQDKGKTNQVLVIDGLTLSYISPLSKMQPN